jgi:hypothetical protein
MIYFPDPNENIRNPLNTNERYQTHIEVLAITYPKIKINPE